MYAVAFCADFILCLFGLREKGKPYLFTAFLQAYKAALLFCLNPASIFFSAPYSETFYALFSFSAFLTLEKGMGVWSGIFLALASSTRANGLINLGFVVYKSMKVVATQSIIYVRYDASTTIYLLT
jgi:phosphatidylinositol glycan class V